MESPAVVTLLLNGGVPTTDAPAATLLDLHARGHLAIAGETVRPLREGALLRGYERMVLERVVAVQIPDAGPAPLGALPFRGDEKPDWAARFRTDVVADARASGLSRPRLGRRETRIRHIVSAVVAGVLALTVLSWSAATALIVFLLGYPLLMTLATRGPEEILTPAGEAAAERWRADEADEPAYRVALGLQRPPVRFGRGDRGLVWSSHGGRWRRVRVDYPPDRFPYGTSTRTLLLIAAGWLALGAWLFSLVADLESRDSPVATALLWAGLPAVLTGGFLLGRTVKDLLSPGTVTGRILWLQEWRHHRPGPDSSEPPRPWLYYLAIDDGTDRTTAWGLPSAMTGGLADGQAVTLRVRPWTRRVTEIVQSPTLSGS
ncbi:hypothetical protein ACTI_61400 [Actinoplanes sp. OR16]|uniref:hypothetical protein n=1 Tax=Actinoplanes sp. OR16 TaxID=946334 RepID=UPI000F70041C|nr:hypothetical protein [Actinoplanes sp. OR16]BBH69455.1 hypothetical protein ACTI_61400 [Actinoplanes sp. OR16]